MKTILFILVVITTLLYGCGNDNPVTINNGNNGLILFQVDTFALHTIQAGFYDTTFTSYKTIDLDSFKVTFRVETNNDSNSYDYAGFGLVDSGSTILTGNVNHVFLNNIYYAFYGYSYTGNSSKTINLRLGLRNNFLPSTYRYISIIDFKIEGL